MKVLEFYDLDGTLSKLNNTFDFLKEYFKEKYKVRYFLLYVLDRLLPFIPIDEKFKRRFLINILIYGLNSKDMEVFYEKKYKKLFMDSLTPLGKELLNRDKKENIYLLTGCIEIPAKNIANTLGFPKDNIICTTLKIKNNKIKGILNDTFGNYKIIYLQRILKRFNEKVYLIYYTDDIKNENKLIELFDVVYLINGDNYERIK